MNKKTQVLLRLAIGASLIAASGTAAMAAPDNIGAIAGTLEGQLKSIGTLIMGAAFIAGVFFVGTGLMRLKAANDSQGQQVKYGEGVWRIGLGACLVALPAVITVGMGTFGLDQKGELDLTTGIKGSSSSSSTPANPGITL